jgi:hypothetical protein
LEAETPHIACTIGLVGPLSWRLEWSQPPSKDSPVTPSAWMPSGRGAHQHGSWAREGLCHPSRPLRADGHNSGAVPRWIEQEGQCPRLGGLSWPAFPLVSAGVVGLRGLEPRTSSLSAIRREPLCAGPFSQVTQAACDTDLVLLLSPSPVPRSACPRPGESWAYRQEVPAPARSMAVPQRTWLTGRGRPDRLSGQGRALADRGCMLKGEMLRRVGRLPKSSTTAVQHVCFIVSQQRR